MGRPLSKVFFSINSYNREPDPFDWYQKYAGIRDCITQHVKPADKILNIGCGNSRIFYFYNFIGLTEEMYKEGFTNSANIDISKTVIKQMSDRYKEECPNAKCTVFFKKIIKKLWLWMLEN